MMEEATTRKLGGRVKSFILDMNVQSLRVIQVSKSRLWFSTHIRTIKHYYCEKVGV